MGDRAVYCARLESVCTARYRGFESPPIRHAEIRGVIGWHTTSLRALSRRIRTQFDRPREARCNRRSQTGEADAKQRQFPPIRHAEMRGVIGWHTKSLRAFSRRI